MSDQPAKKLRVGYVNATIWRNDDFYNVTFTRSYKDGDDWKDGNNFGSGDLPALEKLASRCEAWIAEQA